MRQDIDYRENVTNVQVKLDLFYVQNESIIIFMTIVDYTLLQPEQTYFFQPRHVDTQCTLSCNEGYRLVGSKTRICLPIALWTGVQASCKRKSCKNKLYI